jgi:hypothetical protein
MIDPQYQVNHFNSSPQIKTLPTDEEQNNFDITDDDFVHMDQMYEPSSI